MLIHFLLAVRKFGSKIDKFGSIVYKICLWDQTGTIAVGADCYFVVDSFEECIPKDIIDYLAKRMEMYSSGKIECSDCREEINISDVAGRYFAGSYCWKCWTGKQGKHKDKGGWCEVERNESYN